MDLLEKKIRAHADNVRQLRLHDGETQTSHHQKRTCNRDKVSAMLELEEEG